MVLVEAQEGAANFFSSFRGDFFHPSVEGYVLHPLFICCYFVLWFKNRENRVLICSY
jgi:hypothetical protein